MPYMFYLIIQVRPQEPFTSRDKNREICRYTFDGAHCYKIGRANVCGDHPVHTAWMNGWTL